MLVPAGFGLTPESFGQTGKICPNSFQEPRCELQIAFVGFMGAGEHHKAFGEISQELSKESSGIFREAGLHLASLKRCAMSSA